MAGVKTAQDVKHILHKELFHPNKERILGFIQVSKTEPAINPFKKQENVHYLCVYVTTMRPHKAFVARFKKSEDGEDYLKRRQWELEELMKVDGKAGAGFELCFSGTVFKFEALNEHDKAKFLDEIADACSKYLQKTPPEFLNVTQKATQLIEKTKADMSQLEKTKQQLDERGEKISELEKKTADMANSAESFAENAHRLAMKHQNE